jgi:hypothetical protein
MAEPCVVGDYSKELLFYEKNNPNLPKKSPGQFSFIGRFLQQDQLGV